MFYYLKWCFFVLTLCPLSGQAQLTFEELTQLYHPDIQPIEFNEADSTYVAEVINNDPGFELDMYGLHPDSLKNADDSLRFSTGLGSIREMYNDEMMGVSFNFRKYPNTKAPVLDTVYYDDANWFAVRLSQDQISFDPESTSNRTPKNSSHIVWFSK